MSEVHLQNFLSAHAQRKLGDVYIEYSIGVECNIIIRKNIVLTNLCMQPRVIIVKRHTDLRGIHGGR